AALAIASLPSFSSDNKTGNNAGKRAAMNCVDPDRRGNPGALWVVGLTDDMQLVCFNENRPGNARSIGFVSGLMRGDMLVGIDYRVQDGKLYGVSKMGGVYMLDLRNAMASKVSQL